MGTWESTVAGQTHTQAESSSINTTWTGWNLVWRRLGLHFWFFLVKKPESCCFLKAVAVDDPPGEEISYLAWRSPVWPVSGWADTSRGRCRGTSSSSGFSGSSSSSAGLVVQSPVDEWSSADGSAGWDLIYPSGPPQKQEVAAVSNRLVRGNSGAAVTWRQQQQSLLSTLSLYVELFSFICCHAILHWQDVREKFDHTNTGEGRFGRPQVMNEILDLGNFELQRHLDSQALNLIFWVFWAIYCELKVQFI